MRTKQHFKYGTGIVVPCYNEEERLQLSEFSRFFKTDNTTFFCFVDDGSTDGTKKIVADFVKKNPERAQAVFLSFNQGKAEAVRQGIKTLFQTIEEITATESVYSLKHKNLSLWGIGMPI